MRGARHIASVLPLRVDDYGDQISFSCVSCGFAASADVNAARNIRG